MAAEIPSESTFDQQLIANARVDAIGQEKMELVQATLNGTLGRGTDLLLQGQPYKKGIQVLPIKWVKERTVETDYEIFDIPIEETEVLWQGTLTTSEGRKGKGRLHASMKARALIRPGSGLETGRPVDLFQLSGNFDPDKKPVDAKIIYRGQPVTNLQTALNFDAFVQRLASNVPRKS